MQIDVACDTRCTLGEGAVWDALGQALYWVDIHAGQVHRLEWPGGSLRSWTLPQRVGAVAPRAGGGFICALADGIALADAEFRELTPVGPGPLPPGDRFNDGKCDRYGNFWAGTMTEAGPGRTGALYRVDAGLAVSCHRTGIKVSNGLCFSPDGATLYFADSPDRVIQSAPCDRAGLAGGFTALATTDAPGVPDGATVDAEGCIWNAVWDGGRLCRYRPDGTLDRVVALPVPRPTCCAFGGPDLGTLFVTSASIGLDAAAHPLAGALFALRPGVRGLADVHFAG